MSKIRLSLTLSFLLPYLCLKAQWTEVPNPEPASFYSIVFVGDRFFGLPYPSSQNKRIYSSFDGRIWQNTALPTMPAYPQFALAEDKGKIYAHATSTALQTMFVSADTGRTWQELPSASSTFYDYKQLIFSNGAMLVNWQFYLYRSTDFGQTWVDVAPCDMQTTSRSMAKTGDDIWFGTYEALRKSSDGGKTFNVVSAPYPTGGTVGSVSMYNAGGVLFASYKNWFTQADNRYRSFDGGATWDTLPPANWQVLDMLESEGILYADVAGTFSKSTDYGDTWTPFGEIPAKITSIVSGNNVQLFHTDFNGTYRLSSNGKLLGCAVGDAINTAQNPAALLSNGDKLLFLENEHSHISRDDGTSWEYFRNGLGSNWRGVFEGEHILLPNGLNAAHSTDGGKTWETFPGPAVNGFAPQNIVSTGQALFGQWGPEMYRSDDWGKTWTLVPLPSNFPSLTQIAAHAGRLFILNYNKDAISYSIDNGASWIPTTGMGSNPEVYRIWATEPDNFFINNKLLVYRLKGDAWEEASNGLLGQNGQNFLWPEQLVGVGDTLVLYGYHPSTAEPKMFTTMNGGAKWADISATLPPVNQNFEKRFILHRGFIYMASPGPGPDAKPSFYRRPLADFAFKFASGQVFEDLNQNGQLDAGEPGMAEVVIKTKLFGFHATTDSTGNFQLFVNAQAQDSLFALPTSRFTDVTTPPVSLDGIAPYGLQGIHFQEYKTDLGIDFNLAQRFRPGFGNTVFVHIKNWGTLQTNAQVWLTMPQKIQFLAATPAPSHFSGDTIFWEIQDLLRFENRPIEVSVLLDGTVWIGEKLNLAVHVSPTSAADLDGSNNFVERQESVVSSFDPNDKDCEPERLTEKTVLSRQRLIYTVRFQNTGNFPATFVRILDSLDLTALDISSLQILGASHQMSWALHRQNVLEFFFGNIHLPDSSRDEAGSHGFVRFSILPKNSLKLGDFAQNRAFIYFDFNAPVLTNTVKTLVQLPDLTSAPITEAFDFELSPNPGAGPFRLIFSGQLSESVEVSVSDVFGRTVWLDQTMNLVEPLRLPEFRAGNYWVSIRCGGGPVSKKLVVVE